MIIDADPKHGAAVQESNPVLFFTVSSTELQATLKSLCINGGCEAGFVMILVI